MVEKDDMDVDTPSPQLTMEETKSVFRAMSHQIGVVNAFATFTSDQFRASLKIPKEIWTELSPQIQAEINKIRKSIYEKRERNKEINLQCLLPLFLLNIQP